MNNAALALGCTYNLDANPITDTGKDDNSESTIAGKHETERNNKSLGYVKWYGTSADPAKGCGVVYFTASIGCAFPMASSDPPVLVGPPITTAVATEPKLLAKYQGAQASAGPLGMPTSFPKLNLDSGVSWQRFQWGYITYTPGDAAAYSIGGRESGPGTLKYAAAVTYGRDFDIATSQDNRFGLASDPICVNQLGVASCAGGLVAFRSVTHPLLGFSNYYVLPAHSLVAVRLAGVIGQKYYSLTAFPEVGCLGLPTSHERCNDGICANTFQAFQHGNIYTNTITLQSPPALLDPAFVLDTNVLTAYVANGGPAGYLGLPVEDAPNCGTSGPRTTRFSNGDMVTGDSSHWYAQPPPILPGPEFDDQLQVGSYELKPRLEYRAVAIYSPSAHKVRYYLDFIPFQGGLITLQSSPQIGWLPGPEVGWLIDVRSCQHGENNLTSSGYPEEGGKFFKISAISKNWATDTQQVCSSSLVTDPITGVSSCSNPNCVYTTIGDLGFNCYPINVGEAPPFGSGIQFPPWVEVSDRSIVGATTTLQDTTPETCRVFLSNPNFQTHHLNSRTVHLRWNPPIPINTVAFGTTVSSYSIGLDGVPSAVSTVVVPRVLGGRIAEAVDAAGIPDRMNCYQITTAGKPGRVQCVYLPVAPDVPPEGKTLPDPEHHPSRLQLEVTVMNAVPPQIACPSYQQCRESFVPSIRVGSCNLNGCMVSADQRTCIPDTTCFAPLDTTFNTTGFAQIPEEIAVAAYLQDNGGTDAGTSPPDASAPRGNISYFDSSSPDWLGGVSHRFDIPLGANNINTMSDITQISLKALNQDMRVCVSEIKLLIDNDGNDSRIAFDHTFGTDFGACGADSVGRNSIRSDLPMTVRFDQIRDAHFNGDGSTSNWQSVITNWNTGGPHFTGIPATADFNAWLEGQFTKKLANFGANFQERSTFTFATTSVPVTFTSTSILGGSNQAAHVTTYINIMDHGVRLDFDLVLERDFGCVYDELHQGCNSTVQCEIGQCDPPGTYFEITDTIFTIQNVHADIDLSFFEVLGNAVVDIMTFGIVNMESAAQGGVAGALNGTTVGSLGVPPRNFRFGFPATAAGVGFGVLTGDPVSDNVTLPSPCVAGGVASAGSVCP